MAAVYVEIADCVVSQYPRKYMMSVGNANTPVIDILPLRVMYVAERIWLESEDGITWVKNRYHSNKELSPDELTEFIWVKLRSVLI